MNWKTEAMRLPLKEQWNKLYHIKLGNNFPGIWAHGDGKKNSEVLLQELPVMFKRYGIKSFLDCGCSNFFWMNNLNFPAMGVDYLGVDIVNEIIENNKTKYPGINFRCLNIVEEAPPESDMIFARSVFIHLKTKDILRALNNIKISGSKYLMASTSPEVESNRDTFSLMLVRRNLCMAPFNLPEPLEYVEERCTPARRVVMGIWKL